MKSIQEMFPRASQSMIDANPQLSIQKSDKSDFSAIVDATKAKRRGVMNAAEQEYSLILESMLQRGEILRWNFEGITLRWAGLRYTPDFVVFFPHYIQQVTEFPPDPELDNPIERMRLIEVKGGFIGGKFERAIERFRHARTYWPEFTFEMHQKKKGIWTRIH